MASARHASARTPLLRLFLWLTLPLLGCQLRKNSAVRHVHGKPTRRSIHSLVRSQFDLQLLLLSSIDNFGGAICATSMLCLVDHNRRKLTSDAHT